MVLHDGETRHVDVLVADKPDVEPDRSMPAQAVKDDPDMYAQTPAVTSFSDGAPFYGPVKLPNGITARLSFMQDDTLKGHHTIWAPNGGKATRSDTARSLSLTPQGTYQPGNPRTLYAKIDLEGALADGSAYVVKVANPTDRAIWLTVGDESANLMQMAMFRAPASVRQTDLDLGIAAGPYLNAYTATVGSGVLQPKVDGRPDTADPPELRNDFSINIHFPSDCEGKDTTLCAFDKHGKQFELGSWGSETMADGTRDFGFRGGKAEEVAKVILKVRNYQHVVFKGIHLYPDTVPAAR